MRGCSAMPLSQRLVGVNADFGADLPCKSRETVVDRLAGLNVHRPEIRDQERRGVQTNKRYYGVRFQRQLASFRMEPCDTISLTRRLVVVRVSASTERAPCLAITQESACSRLSSWLTYKISLLGTFSTIFYGRFSGKCATGPVDSNSPSWITQRCPSSAPLIISKTLSRRIVSILHFLVRTTAVAYISAIRRLPYILRSEHCGEDGGTLPTPSKKELRHLWDSEEVRMPFTFNVNMLTPLPISILAMSKIEETGFVAKVTSLLESTRV